MIVKSSFFTKSVAEITAFTHIFTIEQPGIGSYSMGHRVHIGPVDGRTRRDIDGCRGKCVTLYPYLDVIARWSGRAGGKRCSRRT